MLLFYFLDQCAVFCLLTMTIAVYLFRLMCGVTLVQGFPNFTLNISVKYTFIYFIFFHLELLVFNCTGFAL